MATKNGIIVSFWNANSIANKNIDLSNYLSKHNTDVMMVCETYLKPQHRFSVPNYTIHRLDRLIGPKGGVLVLVKSNIEHKLLPSFNLKVIEAIGIQINVNSSPVSLIGAYHPGGNNNTYDFKNDIHKLTSIRNSYFICGDLNSRHRMWNCASSNQAGKILFDEMQLGQFSIFHSNTPTHFPVNSNSNPSTIDIILTNNKHNISDPQTSIDLTSDHLPVHFNINCSCIPIKTDVKISDYANANWLAFKNHLRNTLTR